jgi:hypothetical protein
VGSLADDTEVSVHVVFFFNVQSFCYVKLVKISPLLRMQNINTRAKQLSNFRRVDLKLVSTVSSLFQPLNVPPKEAEIKKDEPVSKSQRVQTHFLLL